MRGFIPVGEPAGPQEYYGTEQARQVVFPFWGGSKDGLDEPMGGLVIRRRGNRLPKGLGGAAPSIPDLFEDPFPLDIVDQDEPTRRFFQVIHLRFAYLEPYTVELELVGRL